MMKPEGEIDDSVRERAMGAATVIETPQSLP
jgi:hypothetical protein